MKILYLLIPAAAVAIGAGCQSGQTRTMTRTTTTTTQISHPIASQQNAPPAVVQQESKPGNVLQFTTDKATYTIETIPSTRLTPTSREGDRADPIYSSNIIAVYVHTNNGVRVNSNATAIPAPANNPQPESK